MAAGKDSMKGKPLYDTDGKLVGTTRRIRRPIPAMRNRARDIDAAVDEAQRGSLSSARRPKAY